MTAGNTRRRAGGWYCRIVLALGPRTDRMGDPIRLQRQSAGDLGFSSSRGPGHWAPKGPTAHATRRVAPQSVPNLGTSGVRMVPPGPSMQGAIDHGSGSSGRRVPGPGGVHRIGVGADSGHAVTVRSLRRWATSVGCRPCSLPSLFHVRARSLVANLDQGRASPPSPEDQCPQPSASCPHRPCRPASGSPCT